MDQGELFKENLEKLIVQKTITQISKDFGVSRQAVYNWMNALEIDYKSSSRKIRSRRNFKKLNSIAKDLLK